MGRVPLASRGASLVAVTFAVTAALALSSTSPSAAGSPFTFTDVTRGAGISFVHENGAAGAFWYPELFGGGVAVLDVDGDHWPDLLFVNSGSWKAAPGTSAGHALYRNNRNGTFTNVTAGSGFDRVSGYGLGATVGDYDNDGRDDVFLTTADGGRLLHNTGNGKG